MACPDTLNVQVLGKQNDLRSFLELGFIAIALVSCNFGVDGTGSKSDPALYEEYKQNMIEMGEKYKK